MRPEEKIEKRFVKKVEKLGCRAYKFEVHGKKGAPDRMVLLPIGIIVFIEFKRPGGGEVSFHQEEFIDDLIELQFEARVYDSWEKPLKWIQSILDNYGYGSHNCEIIR